MIKDEKLKRVLCIVGGMNAGGAETFLMKVYRALDKTKYQMDFYVSTQEEGFYDKEIQSLGGKIFHSTPKSKGFVKSLNKLKDTVKRESYDCVMRVSQHSLSALDLLAAKFGGAQTLIYRSSNSGSGGGRINRILHVLFKWLSMTIPTIKIAPSTEAAEFMFGKNCIKNKKAILIRNAIAVDNFIFDETKRNKIRQQFHMENKFVVGHIGRFTNQKNHDFLVDIFNEIKKKNENSVLLLVGKGELEDKIKSKIETLGLKNSVIFAGVRSNVSELLMAMDVKVFPSFFEGMPNVIIEAQATGLYCVISDTITIEADITGVVEYLSLENHAKIWADRVLLKNNKYERKNMKEIYINKNYDIESSVNKLIKLIFER